MQKRKVIAAFTAAANLALGVAGLAYEFVPAITNLHTSSAVKDAAQQKILSTRPQTKDLTFDSAKPVEDGTGFFDNSKVLTFKLAGSTSTPKEKLTEIVRVRCDQSDLGGKIKCGEPHFSELSYPKVPKNIEDALAKRFDINGFH